MSATIRTGRRATDLTASGIKAACCGCGFATDGICIDAQDSVFVADFSNNAVCKVDPQGRITVLAQSPDGDGSDGGLDQPGEPILWDGKLVVSCFDMVRGPDKVNTKHDKPYTLSYSEFP